MAIVPVSMAERVRVVQLGEEALGKFVAALQCVGGFKGSSVFFFS